MKPTIQRIFLPLIALLCLFGYPVAAAQPTAAIFVQNRAGETFEDKTGLLEDLVTARFTELGYSILSREILLDAMAADSDRDPARTLAGRASAAGLAGALEADMILAVSISSWGQNQRHYRGHGIDRLITEDVLRLTYRLYDAADGGSLTSDTITVTRTRRESPDLNVEEGDGANTLLDRASARLAEVLAARAVESPPAATTERREPVPFTVDISLRNIEAPDVRVDAEGVVTLENTEHTMSPRGVTVALDGVVVGSAPGTLQARPGLHRLHLSRDGFADWERVVNIHEDFHLDVALEPTDETWAHWLEYTEFLDGLRTGARLTEAEVEVLRGRAEQLRQSGFRIDIQVDTDEGLTIENRHRSLFPPIERR